MTVVRSYLTSAMSDQELKAVFALIWQTWVNTYNTEYPTADPWPDEHKMIYPASYPWPDGQIDLNGPDY